jgi:hypothetical protein
VLVVHNFVSCIDGVVHHGDDRGRIGHRHRGLL